MPIFRSNSTLNKNYKNITKGDFSSINKSDIHKLDQYGNSILHIAAKKSNVQLVDYLIKLGANIQLTNYESQSLS